MQTADKNGDFIWRFRLDEKPEAMLNADPLLELIRVQWEQLLKLCVPMQGDRAVQVDGFALMRAPQVVHPIFQDDPRWKDNQSQKQ